MQTENRILDNGGKRQVIEELSEAFPHVRISVFPQTLIVEAINLGDLPALMISSQDGQPVGISYFESYEEGDTLNRVVTTVHVVPHEQVIGVRKLTTEPEKLLHIVELAMDISANSHGGSHRLHVGLLHQDLLRFCTKAPHFLLWKRFALQQSVN